MDGKRETKTPDLFQGREQYLFRGNRFYLKNTDTPPFTK